MRLRRTALAAALITVAAPLVALPVHAETQAEANRRVRVAAGELEDSSAALQRAAASLSAVAAQLPGAQRGVSLAEGELAGARARLAETTTKVRRAELATRAAQGRVDEATAQVTRGRKTIAGLARRSYQQGPLGDLREIFLAGSPQDVVDRAETVKKVFRGQNDVLHEITVSRLRLATTTAELDAKQDLLEVARDQAKLGEERARAVAVRAQQARDRVASLVAQRRAAVADAEAERAADVAEYKQANERSRALAARLRALAAERARQAARAGISGPVLSNSQFAWPTDGYLTSRFGYRTHPIYGDVRFHAGIDIGNGYGRSIWSAAAGTVIQAGPASGYGVLVLVSHGSFNGRDIVTGYAHMSEITVSVGQRVGRGQEVGKIGNAGNSTGPHLHFEVRSNGDPVDPLNWVSPP